MNGALAGFEQKYRQIIRGCDGEMLVAAMSADMSDNYIAAAFAAEIVGFPTIAPLVACNATNRREFPGWHGEIATMRTLLWAGFDPSAPNEAGATALHYMVTMSYGTGCNPRAVRCLLEAGCDPNIAAQSGDTALITLCGHVGWTEEHTECAKLLVNGGADIYATANDGESPLSLLKRCEAISPSEGRRWVIGAIEAELERAELQTVSQVGRA